jgi:hypothetical protein
LKVPRHSTHPSRIVVSLTYIKSEISPKTTERDRRFLHVPDEIVQPSQDEMLDQWKGQLSKLEEKLTWKFYLKDQPESMPAALTFPYEEFWDEYLRVRENFKTQQEIRESSAYLDYALDIHIKNGAIETTDSGKNGPTKELFYPLVCSIGSSFVISTRFPPTQKTFRSKSGILTYAYSST